MTGFTGAHTARPGLTGGVNALTTYGAVVAKLKGQLGDMPPYIHLGGKLFNSPGIGGGTLGSAYDPVEIPAHHGRQLGRLGVAPCGDRYQRLPRRAQPGAGPGRFLLLDDPADLVIGRGSEPLPVEGRRAGE